MYQVDEAKQNWEAGWSVRQQSWELSGCWMILGSLPTQALCDSLILCCSAAIVGFWMPWLWVRRSQTHLRQLQLGCPWTWGQELVPDGEAVTHHMNCPEKCHEPCPGCFKLTGHGSHFPHGKDFAGLPTGYWKSQTNARRSRRALGEVWRQ